MVSSAAPKVAATIPTMTNANASFPPAATTGMVIWDSDVTSTCAGISTIAAHAAMAPHEGRSALLADAAATLAVHALPPFPGHETRAAVGAVHGGTSSNVVPERAEMLLETRADVGEINEDVAARAVRALEGAAATYDTAVEVERIGSVTTAIAAAAARGRELGQ